MADKILFVQSAFKHGCTQDDIERAVETIKVFHAMPLRGKVADQMKI
jgi:hypothetical protein